jgi:hypothetical protein
MWWYTRGGGGMVMPSGNVMGGGMGSVAALLRQCRHMQRLCAALHQFAACCCKSEAGDCLCWCIVRVGGRPCPVGRSWLSLWGISIGVFTVIIGLVPVLLEVLVNLGDLVLSDVRMVFEEVGATTFEAFYWGAIAIGYAGRIGLVLTAFWLILLGILRLQLVRLMVLIGSSFHGLLEIHLFCGLGKRSECMCHCLGVWIIGRREIY